MYRSGLCMALLGSISLSAQAFSAESLTITSGSLNITYPFGEFVFGALSVAPGAAATETDGTVNGVIDADGHHGSRRIRCSPRELPGVGVFGYFAHNATTLDINSTTITNHDPDPDGISISGTPWDPLIRPVFSGFLVCFNGNKILQGGTGTGDGIAIPTVECGPKGCSTSRRVGSPTTPRGHPEPDRQLDANAYGRDGRARSGRAGVGRICARGRNISVD